MQPALFFSESDASRPYQARPKVARFANGRKWLALFAFGTILLAAGVGAFATAGAVELAANVDETRILQAERDSANWLTYGRTYSEQRFSPLAKIKADNVKQLSLAWYADIDINRGQEATPLMIDGVLYVSTAWSMVKAYDATSGALLWSYDPHVPRELGVRGCCDVVSRGVAAWKGRIFVATFDGRLVALDARTGTEVWRTMTVDPAKPFTITQAPRVIKGRVVIGTSGAEYGVRGYISAYDSETGKLAWRFYTVPGDPSQPFEQPILAEAAKTWHGEWWKLGGGGSVWEAISYDPELNLIYFGVSNGVEWNQKERSASQGDNWFLSSIVAVNADTGAYAWHFQATPGEEWDFDAVQQLILADLTIDGKPRQVLMQANKNGFFYVLDRKTGQFISAKNFTPVTWASGVDPRTGRPKPGESLRQDRQACSDAAGCLGGAQLASDGVQSSNRARVHSGPGNPDDLRAGEGFQSCADRLERRDHYDQSPQCEGISGGLGSGESKRGVARQLSRPVERRRSYDGRRPCDAGKCRGRLQRLSRRDWRETVVDVRTVLRDGGSRDL